MEAKGEISMRMVHCEDCGKRYDYDVDGFCPRCGAFNQPVWVRSGGTAAAAESPAAQQKRMIAMQTASAPGAGPSISLQGTETRRSSRRNRNFSRGRSPQHAGEREPIQLPRRGECFWDWKWCQIWQWTWWEMPFLTCSPDRLCRAPNGI